MYIQPYKKILLATLFAIPLLVTAVFLSNNLSTVWADSGCTSQQVQNYNGSADACQGVAPTPVDTTKASGSTDFVGNYINPFIDFLTGAVGIVVTISLVSAGIQYASSADDPQKVAAARRRIVNTVIALLAFIFLWAFLQWIVPGGVFGSAGPGFRNVASAYPGLPLPIHSFLRDSFGLISGVF